MNDKRIVSLISLILMLMALLGPWPIASLGNLESALAFSASAALLSLGLALFSRSEYFSRIVLWGFGFSIGLCLVGIAVSVPIFFYRSAVLQAREAQVEQMHAEVAARDALALAHARTEQEKAIRETHSEKDATRTDNGNGEPIAVVMVMHPAELRNGNSIQRAAATKTLGLLTDKDYCGVLSYGQVQGEVATNWLWGKGSALESVGQHRKDWNAAIAKSTSGDFPEFRSAFQMALSAMKEVNANQKAMIVFTDGDPVFEDESFIDKFRDAGIKVSVIHVDIHAINRKPLLQRIVDATGGAYHYVLESQAAVVEKLFEREVQSLREDSSSSLKKIGLAFQLIQEKTGSFPGSRMKYLDRRNTEFEHPFSWRVAILPYIGQQQLFDDYRFDEPWDGSNNISLLNRIPDVYRSSYAPADQPLGNSNLLGFACENGGLGSHSGESLSSFTDGTSNTILIVESSQSVPWTKPEDLTELNDQSFAGQPLRFVLADGSVSQMSPIDSVKLEKMITRNGGEVVTDHPNKETN